MRETLLTRISAFERERERRTSTRIEPCAHGTAYLNLDFPHRWDSNFLWIEDSLAYADPEALVDELVEEADRILGGAGLEHRELVIDDITGARLAPIVRARRWTTERREVMIRRRTADRPASVSVREVGFDEARSIQQEVVRRAPWSSTEAENAELVEFGRRLEEKLGASFFVAEAEGRPASVCELYRLGDVAQVENVDTLEEFRGRGLARAVVLAAAEAAADRGSDLILICADADDWPKVLYGKLGFDPVTYDWTFRKMPGDRVPR